MVNTGVGSSRCLLHDYQWKSRLVGVYGGGVGDG